MAEIKIKEGSVTIEFTDDNHVVHTHEFPNAVWDARANNPLWASRVWTNPAGKEVGGPERDIPRVVPPPSVPKEMKDEAGVEKEL